MMKNKVIILADEIQTGKTTFLAYFSKNNESVGGILTPVIDGKRMFYDIVDKVYFDMEARANEESLSVGKYFFSAAAFARAQNILLNTIENRDLNYVIIDEIGPLEITQRGGFFEVMTVILNSAFTYTLILVVRKNLIDDFLSIFDIQYVDVLSLTDFKKS